MAGSRPRVPGVPFGECAQGALCDLSMWSPPGMRAMHGTARRVPNLQGGDCAHRAGETCQELAKTNFIGLHDSFLNIREDKKEIILFLTAFCEIK